MSQDFSEVWGESELFTRIKDKSLDDKLTFIVKHYRIRDKYERFLYSFAVMRGYKDKVNKLWLKRDASSESDQVWLDEVLRAAATDTAEITRHLNKKCHNEHLANKERFNAICEHNKTLEKTSETAHIEALGASILMVCNHKRHLIDSYTDEDVFVLIELQESFIASSDDLRKLHIGYLKIPQL